MTIYKVKYIIDDIKIDLEGRMRMKQELKRYDVVLVNFGSAAIDGEQAGIRPAVIIQNNKGNFYSNTTIVIPFTSKQKKINQPTHTLIKKGRDKGLIQDSILLGECLRQVSEKRIEKHLGRITDDNEKKEIRRVYDANFGD